MKKYYSIALIVLIPLGELKSIFYQSDKKVDWYALSDTKRYLCNVLEDYANAITFIVLFGFILFAPKTKVNRVLCEFLFIIALLDLLHLGAWDMQVLVVFKIGLALMIWLFWNYWKTIVLWIKQKITWRHS